MIGGRGWGPVKSFTHSMRVYSLNVTSMLWIHFGNWAPLLQGHFCGSNFQTNHHSSRRLWLRLSDNKEVMKLKRSAGTCVQRRGKDSGGFEVVSWVCVWWCATDCLVKHFCHFVHLEAGLLAQVERWKGEGRDSLNCDGGLCGGMGRIF